MPKFRVTVSRTTVRYLDIEVTADDEKEARKLAIEESYDLEFSSEKDAERIAEAVVCAS